MPKQFNCPISLEVMTLPVITNTGHTYDFISIATYLLETGYFSNPLSREKITSLTINHIVHDDLSPLNGLNCLKIAFLSVMLGRNYPQLELTTIINLSNVAHYFYHIESNQLIPYLIRRKESAIFIELMRDSVYIKNAFISQIVDSPLCQAAAGSDLEMMIFFCQLGFDPNQKNESGESPLFIAAKLGCVDIVDYLVSIAEVDVNTMDLKGDTAFNIATYRGHLDCMKSLRKRDDLNINYVNARGTTPIWLAVFIGRRDILLFLLAIPGILITQPSCLGTTPYKLALKQRRPEFAKLIKNTLFSLSNGGGLPLKDAELSSLTRSETMSA